MSNDFNLAFQQTPAWHADLGASSLLRSAHSSRWMWRAGLRFAEFSKRFIDCAAAAQLLILSAPLLIAVAAAIKLTDKGSVLYWQQRVGLHGHVFAFPKFRSMVPDADRRIVEVLHQNHHGSSVTYKSKHDPRVTWIGGIIRRFSIDEIPQLWCVLRGDMSLVGPRPALPREVSQYGLADRRRLEVKPGLTCIWQVSGRADIPFEGQVRLDLEYIENHSLILDLKLLLQTVPAVLSARGAY